MRSGGLQQDLGFVEVGLEDMNRRIDDQFNPDSGGQVINRFRASDEAVEAWASRYFGLDHFQARIAEDSLQILQVARRQVVNDGHGLALRQ